MAALRVLNIIPDMIVGASIGAGIGAFTAKYLREGNSNAAQATLSAVTRSFVEVEKIAQTKLLEQNLQTTWKHLQRQDVRFKLALGAKHNVDRLHRLLVNDVRPPSQVRDQLKTLRALGDAIEANQLSATIKLAQEAIAAVITSVDNSAPNRLWSLMGTAGLTKVIDTVLGTTATSFQPFLTPTVGPKPVAHFATATRLQTEGSECLGTVASSDENPVTLKEIMLASAAFPGIFEPRRIGAWTYFDGGVLDNMPVLPAIDLLASLQVHDFQTRANGETSKPALRRMTEAYFRERLASPHLLIAICLKYKPVDPTIESITTKIGRRGNHAKIESMTKAAVRTLKLFNALAANATDFDASFNQYVCLDIKKVVPSKLNGTFEFEGTMGLDNDTMNHSIVDGCFQTLRTFSEQGSKHSAPSKSDECVFFRRADTSSFACPFASIQGRGWRRSKPMLRAVCIKKNSGTPCMTLSAPTSQT